MSSDYVLPQPGSTFESAPGADGQTGSGAPLPLAGFDAALRSTTDVFGRNNVAQRFDFWFAGFPAAFQTLTDELLPGRNYFFQSPGGITVEM